MKTMMFRRPLAWVPVALGMLLAGCGPASATGGKTAPAPTHAASSPSSSQPVKVPVLLPLSGQAAFLGKQEKAAVLAYQQYTNQHGGIQGRPLQFVIQDSESSPKVSVELATQIIARHTPIFLGPSLVATCGSIGPLVAHGPVDWCLSPGVYPPRNGYQFGGAAPNNWVITAELNYFKAHHWDKIAALVSNDATGADGLRWLKRLLATPSFHALHLVKTQHFSDTATSIASQMAVIKTAHPQALFTWTTGTPQQVIFNGIQQSGLNLPVSICDGNQVDAEMKAYAKILPKNFFTAVGRYAAYRVLPPGPGKSAVLAFRQAFAKSHIHPDIGQALAWDAARVVVHALRAKGPNATAKQYRNYIQSIKGLPGASGTFNFSPSHHHGLSAHDFYVVTWNTHQGRWVPLSGPGGTALRKS